MCYISFKWLPTETFNFILPPHFFSLLSFHLLGEFFLLVRTRSVYILFYPWSHSHCSLSFTVIYMKCLRSVLLPQLYKLSLVGWSSTSSRFLCKVTVYSTSWIWQIKNYLKNCLAGYNILSSHFLFTFLENCYSSVVLIYMLFLKSLLPVNVLVVVSYFIFLPENLIVYL